MLAHDLLRGSRSTFGLLLLLLLLLLNLAVQGGETSSQSVMQCFRL
jgi:hypothetical protein